jgi:Anion-transporting ATPase
MWPTQARLHVVTGKGGTGKTTVAAALAVALATGGGRTLLVEVEGRQGIAHLFDSPPLPYAERRIAVAPGGGEVRALAVDAEEALLEYFSLFYNLGFAGRTLRRMGAIEFATTLAPGLRDVLLTGKVKEATTRVEQGVHAYDAVVLDAPPTGRVVKFLDVTRAMAELAKGGPIHSQSTGVVRLLHSADTAVHVVTLLEDLPVAETLETIAELDLADLRPGAVLINRARPSRLPVQTGTAAAGWAGHSITANGQVDADRVRAGLLAAGLDLNPGVLDGLVAETVEHAIRVDTELAARARLADAGMPLIELPDLTDISGDGVDLGGVYELAEALREQGVRCRRLP